MERRAEHRRPAQERALTGCEPVDARREQRLDCLGQLISVLATGSRRGQFLQEQRVAGSALGQRRELLVRQAGLARGGLDQLARVGDRQRLQPEGQRRQRRDSLGSREATGPGRRVAQASQGRVESCAPGSAEARTTPRPSSGRPRRGRRSAREERTEQRAQDAVQPCASERRLELIDLRRRVHLHVERGPEQRRPRRELRIDLLEPLCERRSIAEPSRRSVRPRAAIVGAAGTGGRASTTRTARSGQSASAMSSQ